MSDPVPTPSYDYRKLQLGSAGGGGALGLAILVVWLINRKMEPPMPAEIAAAAAGGFVWALNNFVVWLVPHRSP